ncbi:hypothetical protein EC973_003925 [Apophysomyces ossiformis]|uniref:Uncharacterized protein n=1 Tax=Apophysomyces ossiformis TaxID=679940 RepID=A0A8H7BGL6_9FUNG|nr:hypothetical protein EC973_003925 [Apophysomyces ossiformis]
MDDRDAEPISFKPSIDTFVLSNTLSEYYENIADQVMETMTNDILTSVEQLPMHTQRFGTSPQDDCLISLDLFISTLQNHLWFVRSDLLGCIRSLVETHLPALLSSSFPDGKDDVFPLPQMIADLTRDIKILNRVMRYELGRVINPKETSGIVLRQSMSGCPTATRLNWQRYLNVNGYLDSTRWLQNKLERIEQVLHVEFDARIKDIIQSVTEDFLIDE